MRSAVTMLLFAAMAAANACCAPTSAAGLDFPRFQEYPAGPLFKGPIAQPILSTREQRNYGTKIREGLSKGVGVWNGSWRSGPRDTRGPNFAGHYVVIRWGCGSNCLMMAVVDAVTGVVYSPPLSGVGTELFVPIDPRSEQEIDFQPDSSLIVLRNACADFKSRSSCGTYYFNWHDNRFDLVRFATVPNPR